MISQTPVQKMFDTYHCHTIDERRNALKEIVQEIALLGLDRGGFFKKAAFYGGTALRIFHGPRCLKTKSSRKGWLTQNSISSPKYIIVLQRCRTNGCGYE
ncbi:MAG: nucleotidyl transferase AbiEii/AbiGii toxin family protein, partial [Spirochaetaceae bacterium]|nr:nucleotidyl transferase AbiEii/AbiGii toxin family protein [Spirochaetaceae bacterium]